MNELNSVIKDITKKYGMDGIMQFGVPKDRFTSTFSLGTPGFDFCTYNAIPEGCFIEVTGAESSGKTLLAYLIASNYIRKEKNKPVEERRHILFVDAEHTADPQWAMTSTGYNMNDEEIQTMYLTPLGQSAEEILDMVIETVKTGRIGLVIFDSLTAMASQQVSDETMTKKDMGTIAKVLADFVRRSTGLFARYKTTFIGINGLIMNISGYGCLHANTKITMVDGRKLTIKEIVKNKIEGEVWSLNESTNEFEPKKIIGWHDNGKVEKKEDYIHIETLAIDSLNGHNAITVTPIHKVLTQDGWKEAKDITLNDTIATKCKSVVNGTLSDFLWGTLIGDCTITNNSSRNASGLKFQDNINRGYVEWKVNKLNKAFEFTKHIYNDKERYTSKTSSELKCIKDELGERNPLSMLKNHYSDLGLAVWYMDDGHLDVDRPRISLCIKRFKFNDEIKKQIVDFFKNELGLDCYWNKGSLLQFSPKGTIAFLERIYKYVPKCMEYKLLDQYKNKYDDFTLDFEEKYVTKFVKITNIRFASDKQMKELGKYDISVEDNHNYLAGSMSNGLVVHNSPETTGGGTYWRRACSLRLKVKRGDYFDSDLNTLKSTAESPAGHIVEIAVLKTKFCRWDRKLGRCYLDYTKGIDVLQDTVQVATHFGIVDNVSSGWYMLKDPDTNENICDENGKPIKINGQKNVRKYFSEHLDLWKKVYDKTYEMLSKKDDSNIVSFEKMLGLDVEKEFDVDFSKEE